MYHETDLLGMRVILKVTHFYYQMCYLKSHIAYI
jgi:hypothetical protein